MGANRGSWSRTATSVIAALGLVVVLASCSGGSTKHAVHADPTTTPSAVPTSSPAPGSLAREQVIAAHKAYEAAFSVCAQNPATCDVSAVVVAGSPAATGVAKLMAQYAKDGLRVRSSPGTYYVYEDFALADTGNQAVLTVCTVDADVTYDPHGGPQGQDVIVNDRVDSDRSGWTFRLDGQVWKLYVSNVITQWKGQNGCPPRPAA
jgi:hypothetical protein